MIEKGGVMARKTVLTQDLVNETAVRLLSIACESKKTFLGDSSMLIPQFNLRCSSGSILM